MQKTLRFLNIANMANMCVDMVGGCSQRTRRLRFGLTKMQFNQVEVLDVVRKKQSVSDRFVQVR